ncbi:hypothetical protein BJX66DRAFT_318205 [Aspergillus keveii]|uniref:Carboxymuconolactone decarboxylase-like domain-containing protein n=1 Tax=Aspergillus keveii TaxID=714993 RepID=A0ABR4FKM1_9EURO
MCDWSQDKTMASWDATYVSTNLRPGSPPFDSRFFLGLNRDLSACDPEVANIAPAIIAVACCAVNRADIVGKFFDYVSEDYTPEQSQEEFLRLREAITIVYPFLGMPTCIPACYGMIGVMERKGPEFASVRRLRAPIMTEEDVAKGKELRARIYAGVGNSGIFSLMDRYFTELFACSTAFTWGYLISKANEEVFEVWQSHLILVAAITALGAVRQTKSHVKATIGIGNKVDTVKAVLDVVLKIAEWAGRPLTTVPNVDDCARQIQQSLNK